MNTKGNSIPSCGKINFQSLLQIQPIVLECPLLAGKRPTDLSIETPGCEV